MAPLTRNWPITSTE